MKRPFTPRKLEEAKREGDGVDKFKEHEKQILQRGRAFHKFVVDRFNKPDAVSTDQSVIKLWSSVQLCTSERVLAEKPSFLEQPVSHPVLCYRGVVDCVGRLSLKDEAPLSIIEWKTSDRKNRPKRISESFDFLIQNISSAVQLGNDATSILSTITSLRQPE
ncbi:hypothetical protein ACOME3_008269 [Neoechinorhynchus agilis]